MSNTRLEALKDALQRLQTMNGSPDLIESVKKAIREVEERNDSSSM